MGTARPPRQPAGAISTILTGLRRAPRQIRRSSRDVVENAVTQLFDAAVQPWLTSKVVETWERMGDR